jgi:hypothetical protein
VAGRDKEDWGEDEREVLSEASWITFGKEDDREIKSLFPNNVIADTLDG